MAAAYRLAVLGLGLALLYFATASAVWNMGLAQGAIGLPGLIPDDPDIAMARAMAEFRAGAGSISRGTPRDVERAARLDPLEDEPLLFAGLRRIAAGDGRRAALLLEEARRRDPRLPETRLALLGHYVKAGDAAAAGGEIGALSRLVPQARDRLVAVQAGLVMDRRTRAAARVALPGSPLRIDVIRKLAWEGASAQSLLELSADLKGIAAAKEAAGWVGAVINARVQRGDLAGARRLWAHFHAVQMPQAAMVPYDGKFAGPAGPPFGWKVSSGPAGLAVISGGALRVRYYGRGRAEFARQLMELPPGAYRLRFTAAGPEGQPLPDLAWRIACREGGEPLLDYPLTPSFRFGTAPASGFAVPASGCGAQWLTLVGRPAEFPRTRSAVISEVSIAGAAGP